MRSTKPNTSKTKRDRRNASYEDQTPAKQDLMRRCHDKGVTTIRLCAMFAVSYACAVQVVYGAIDAYKPLGSMLVHALKHTL